jgi:hypothetical protein
MVPRKPRARKRQMVPREPTTFAEAEQALIQRAILVWRPFYEKKISTEASHEVFKAEFLRRLQAGAGTLDPAKIVELARNGHPFAAAALRDFIELAMDEDRYSELPMCVRDYGREVMAGRTRAPTGYPSTAWQGLVTFKRDTLIISLINGIVARWPHRPLLYSKKGCASAAAIVGKCFNLSETQAKRIFQARKHLDKKYCEFLDSYRLEPIP